jgi:hypothetical protein
MAMAMDPKMPPQKATDGLTIRRPSLARTLVIAMLTGLVLLFVFSTSMAGIFRYDNPALALRFAPWDAVANSAIADQQLQSGDFVNDLGTVVGHARSALTRSPLSPSALRVLGLVDELQGQPARARIYLEAAGRLSRRDLGTQLWLINDRVAREDVPGALTHFDIAMRTSVIGRTILFPILGNALDDPALSGPIFSVMSKEPNWLHDFVVVCNQQGRAVSIARYLPGLSRKRTPSAAELTQITIDQLVRENRYVVARALFGQSMDKIQSATQVFDSQFEGLTGFAPFVWAVSTDSKLSAVLAQPGLAIAADRNSSGIAISQTMALPPGNYSLATRGVVTQGGSASWAIRCLPPAPTWIVKLDVARRGETPPTVPVQFSVPSKCEGQLLALTVDAPVADRGLLGKIDQVTISQRGP